MNDTGIHTDSNKGCGAHALVEVCVMVDFQIAAVTPSRLRRTPPAKVPREKEFILPHAKHGGVPRRGEGVFAHARCYGIGTR